MLRGLSDDRLKFEADQLLQQTALEAQAKNNENAVAMLDRAQARRGVAHVSR